MTTLTLTGKISTIEDISTEQVIAHRLFLGTDAGPEITCVSFDYKLPFSSFIGKHVRLEAFVDEVPIPEAHFNQCELIVTQLALANSTNRTVSKSLLHIAC